MKAWPSCPCRTGWSARNAAQPECRTVTRVPKGTDSNITSTSVLSPGAKFTPRHLNWNRDGGCQAVMLPIVNAWGPDGDSNSSTKRPPSRGSKRNTPRCFPAMRNLGPVRHHKFVSSVKIANAVAGSVATVTLTFTRSEGVMVLVNFRAVSLLPHGREMQPVRPPSTTPLPPATFASHRTVLSATCRRGLARPARFPFWSGRCESTRSVAARADGGSEPAESVKVRRRFHPPGEAFVSISRLPLFASDRPAPRGLHSVFPSARAIRPPDSAAAP
jgi:hypothetical protein